MTVEDLGFTDAAFSDAELCHVLREGNAWPLAVLWERHHEMALRWAKGKDSQAAEDVVADAFDAVFRELLRGKGPTDSFRSYLFRTINTGFSRHWTVEKRTVGADELDVVIDPTAPMNEVLLSEREEQLAAAAALRDLPERWNYVILEVEVGGRSVQDVAAELEMTPNSASVLLKRAKEGLRKSWLKRMHPPAQLGGACAACVAQFSEIRWGKKNGKRRGQAEAHLEGCPACRQRWKRFVEQAAVIGMVSAGVIAVNKNWKRSALVGTGAAAASIGVLTVAAGLAMPMLFEPPAPVPMPVPEHVQSPAASSDSSTNADADAGLGRSEGEQLDAGSAGSASDGAAAADPVEGVSPPVAGDAGASSGDERATLPGLPPTMEFANSAHVNVNDLDLDGDGEPGAPTNEVWSRWGGVQAVKVDASDPIRGLAGAKFKLWASSQTAGCLVNSDLVPVLAADGDEFVVVSGAQGLIEIPALWVGDDERDVGTMENGLSQRCYVLEEIAAPRGYVLPSGQKARTEVIARSVLTSEHPQPVIIANDRSAWAALVNTGGPSLYLLAGGGASIVLSGGLLLIARRQATVAK
ncbi:sigma-70 family RNA polymerase sigma factor [Leucobacter sp. cx-328]|uniref:sigma-70 family RNA polymerase sigma factor n=1 Tax=unclassified Leucobacter TaxID=2621730 RepID=UPI00165E7767|nr:MULTISPECIES: sigma-70 family RNA polymerase sigma factor [unclassified Leucobacter]MBC9944824.1 sigma-70 family RNA polymerase sigma factor [Leucobacter sp. cx-328]